MIYTKHFIHLQCIIAIRRIYASDSQRLRGEVSETEIKQSITVHALTFTLILHEYMAEPLLKDFSNYTFINDIPTQYL